MKKDIIHKTEEIFGKHIDEGFIGGLIGCKTGEIIFLTEDVHSI